MPWQGIPFRGRVGLTVEEAVPDWPTTPRPPAGTPNVLYIVLDDVGFSHLGCYGSPIATSNMDRLAGSGLLYGNFHTTAMCLPTRAAMLTGQNHHSNGIGCISELAQGFPGYHPVMPPTNGMLSEILKERGFATFAVGKWHLTPTKEVTMAGPFDRWPLGRGFDRFYGFLGGETHQFYPGLVYDNHFVHSPKGPEKGYHLTVDLTEKAAAFIRDLRSVDPSKPFFMYYSPAPATPRTTHLRRGSRATRARSTPTGMPTASKPTSASWSSGSSRPKPSSPSPPTGSSHGRASRRMSCGSSHARWRSSPPSSVTPTTTSAS